jgi:hypothetical protein
MCQRDCRDSDGGLAAKGLYGEVLEGRIAVTPLDDRLLEREFGAGEFFHLADERSSPTPLFLPPPFLRSKQDEQARFTEQTGIAIAPGSTGVTPGATTTSGLTGTLTNGLSGTVAGASGSIGGIVSPVVNSIGPAVSGVTSPIVASIGSAVSALTPVLAPIAAPVTSALPVGTPIAAPVVAPTLPLPVGTPIGPPIGAPTVPPIIPPAPITTGPTPGLPSLPRLGR